MEKRQIGKSELKVSVLSLGTMTFGAKTNEEDANAQLDLAIDRGINFIDTAEIYPAPVDASTYGESERIIGNWLREKGARDNIVLSTKIAGPGQFIKWVRGGASQYNKKNLVDSVEGSLRRLKTDYIDLFQLHWPDRAIEISQPHFRTAQRELNYSFATTMETLNNLVLSGKIRYVGVCNESPWGIMKFLECEKIFPSAKIISLQNPYNLLNRGFEKSHAEIAHRENLSLLAYSPLAMGLLTDRPSDSLDSMKKKIKRSRALRKYLTPTEKSLAVKYAKLAKSEGKSFSNMALTFVTTSPFIASAIIGNTNVEQLKENLSGEFLKLSKSLSNKINRLHKEHQSPCL